MPTASEPRPCAVVPPGPLADCAQAARSSGAAMRRASLRMVITSFRRFLCVRRRQPGWLGSPALPEQVLGVLGRQIRSVGLGEEAVTRYPRSGVLEGIGAGICECPGERDVQPQIKPCRELVGSL